MCLFILLCCFSCASSLVSSQFGSVQVHQGAFFCWRNESVNAHSPITSLTAAELETHWRAIHMIRGGPPSPGQLRQSVKHGSASDHCIVFPCWLMLETDQTWNFGTCIASDSHLFKLHRVHAQRFKIFKVLVPENPGGKVVLGERATVDMCLSSL